jgi:hypothetical protein
MAVGQTSAMRAAKQAEVAHDRIGEFLPRFRTSERDYFHLLQTKKVFVFLFSTIFFWNPDASRDSVRSVLGDESQTRQSTVKWEDVSCSPLRPFT